MDIRTLEFGYSDFGLWTPDFDSTVMINWATSCITMVGTPNPHYVGRIDPKGLSNRLTLNTGIVIVE